MMRSNVPLFAAWSVAGILVITLVASGVWLAGYSRGKSDVCHSVCSDKGIPSSKVRESDNTCFCIDEKWSKP